MADIELASMTRKLPGFPSLSEHIAAEPDRECLIFNRFDRLAARNILYLQSELADLQEQLDEFDREDAYADGAETARECARSWKRLHELSGTDDNARRRLDLAIKIRVTLKEYRKALQFERDVTEMDTPAEHHLRKLRCSFLSDSDRVPVLTGASGRLYEKRNELVALKGSRHDDKITTFLKQIFPSGSRKHPIDGKTASFAHLLDVLPRWLSAFLTLFSAVFLLIGATFSLYHVRTDVTRLYVMAAFTALFVGAVGLLTNATRSELFAASAAYCGVLVVFIGSAPHRSENSYFSPSVIQQPSSSSNGNGGSDTLSADGVSAVVIGLLALLVAVVGVYFNWKSIRIALQALRPSQPVNNA